MTKLSTVLDQVDNGTMLLPEFQCGYVWNRDPGEVTIDVHREVLALHTFDGRTFDPALRIHAGTAEMRRQVRWADAPEAVWSSMVDQIDRLAAAVDSGEVELILTEAGVVERRS